MKKTIYLIMLCVFSCNDYVDSPLPYVPVNIRINLHDIRHQNLQYDGGFLYLKGGIRGIIVYRKMKGMYYAFERNCTFQPKSSCAQVSVDPSTFFMVDSCCGSQFDFEGNVLSGVASLPLQRYRATQSGNELIIEN